MENATVLPNSMEPNRGSDRPTYSARENAWPLIAEALLIVESVLALLSTDRPLSAIWPEAALNAP